MTRKPSTQAKHHGPGPWPRLLAAAKKIIVIHDQLSADIEAGKSVDDAFDRWDAAVTELVSAVAKAESNSG